MLSLMFCMVVVSWLSIPCNALPGILAPQTSAIDDGPFSAAWTPRPTTFVENVLKRDISIGTESSTSSPPLPPSSMAPSNHTLRHGTIAGIALGCLSIVACILSCWDMFSSRMRPLSHQKQRFGFASKPTPKVAMSQVQFTSSVATFFALPNGQPRSDRVLTPFKDDSVELKFLALLALFGSNGVPLRELIMLASLRVSTNTSHNHWLEDGERGPLGHAINAETPYPECSFLEAFTRETSTIYSIEMFEARLVSLHLINVDYQDLSETQSLAQQCWFIDGRVWRINESGSYAGSFRLQLQFEVFLEVFAAIPCKDISPLAERQREMYYYHAHQPLVHLYKNGVLPNVPGRNMKRIVLVILQILSHRFQKHDEALLRFAKWNLPESGLHPDWDIVLLVARLKATISTNHGNLLQIRDKVLEAVECPVIRGDSSPRAKGLSGWLLVELLDTAEVQDCTRVIDDAVRMGIQWMQRLLGSKLSSLEQTMLYRAFARFGTSDDPEPQPRQQDLLFGYHLSRAGYIEKAEKVLLAGLEYNVSSPMSPRIWSYHFELVSLMLRAGRCSDAEAWLASARESAIHRNAAIDGTDFWKRSGECGEIFILLGLYQADCDMAAGKLKFAEDWLKDTMERTLFVRDSYIGALRLALRTRLLNVQMWQEVWECATVTAQELIKDTIASGHCLSTTRSSYSVIIIVLSLINKLLWIGDVLAAARLLESVKRFEDADHCVLPLNIKLYLERRRSAVSHSLSLEGSSRYIRHVEDSGADAEDAITFAPVVDQVDRDPHAHPFRAQGPTSVNCDTQPTKMMPSRSGHTILKQSSAYKWSLELEHARVPTPGLTIQSDEAKVLDTKDIGSAQRARHGATRERMLRLDVRRGAVHRGNPFAEELAQAPHPPTHEPYNLEDIARDPRERELLRQG